VSKTRKRSTKKTSSKRAKAPKARPKKAKMMAKAGFVELRPIREKLKADVETLGDAISKSPGGRPELEEALKRMSRFLADIDDICGSNMMLSIS
jgi:hypothetical protein